MKTPLRLPGLVLALLISANVSLAQTPPTITAQPPASVDAASGWGLLQLTVSATSNNSGVLSYQWYRDGAPVGNGTFPATLPNGRVVDTIIGGSQASQLRIDNPRASDSGSYHVVITDSVLPGQPTVSNATLVTFTDQAPTITAQTAPTLNATSGGNARIFVNFGGSRPHSLQWRRNGVPIPGMNGASLNAIDLYGVTSAQAGTYTVDVVNAYGSATFTPVQLQIATQSDPLDTWRWANPDPQGNNLFAATVGPDGRLVAVGRGGTVISTIDGESGNIGNSGTGFGLAAITYDPATSRYLAVGGFSTIVASTDALAWTPVGLTGVDHGYNGIAKDNSGNVVLVGTDFGFRPSTRALILRSTNGGAWSAPQSVGGNFTSLTALAAVTHGNGRFVAVGPTGNAFHSDDAGLTWSASSTSTSANLNAIAHANGRFIAVGNGGNIRVSSDGITFSTVTSNTANNLLGVNFLAASSTWVAVGAGGTVLTSTDNGDTWLASTLPGAGALNFVGANGNLVIIGGQFGRLLGCASGATFSAGDLEPFSETALNTYNTAVNFADWEPQSSSFLAVSGSGEVLSAWNDGRNWWRRAQLSGFLTQWARLGNRLLISGSNGTVWDSTDNGFSWNAGGSLTSQQLNSVAAGSGRAVVVGNAGFIFHSTDGQNWTAATSGTGSNLRRVAHGNGRFVAVGGNDAGGSSIVILTSDDGALWTSRQTGTTGQLWGVEHADGVWLAAGAATVNGGTPFVLRSTDNGVTWSRIEVPGLTFCYQIRHLDGRWLITGSNNALATSSDGGLTWGYKSLPAQPNINTMRGLAASPDAFVIVGNDGAILHSAPRPARINAVSGPANVIQGGSGQLFVNASSVFPMTFQWRLNGEPIAGATGSTLWVNNFQSGNAGNYDVVITTTMHDEDGPDLVTTTVTAPVTLSVAPAAGVSFMDQAFTRPQFWRHALPGRLTAGLNGSVYATFNNGGTVNTVGTHVSGAVIKLHADGSVDTSFNMGSALVDAWTVVPLADGRILVGGVAREESGQTGLTLFRIFRFNADGSRDWSYFSPVFSAIPRYMTLQPDGKLLVTPSAGSFSNNGGLSNLVRLNADGSQDWSFQMPSFNTTNPIFAPIALDAQGRIVIAGQFGAVNGVARPGVARLNPDGSLDQSFAPSGFTFAGPHMRGLAVQTQGSNANKVLVAGGNILVDGVSRPVIRLLENGALDPNFTLAANDTIGADPSIGRRARLLNLLPDDRFTVVSARLARFNANGDLDATFTPAVMNQEAFWMDTLADGRVLLPPEFGTTLNGAPAAGPVRLAANGVVDATFAPGVFRTLVYPLGLAVQPDGRILSWGNYTAVGAAATPRAGFTRFNPDGSLDSLQLSGVADLHSISAASVLNDGRILASVFRGTYQSNLTTALHRFNTDGTVDNSFSLAVGVNAANLRVLPDNRILTWSLTAPNLLANDVVLRRLTADGAIDSGYAGPTATTFGQVHRDANNVITEIVLGQFRIVGHYADGRALAVATPANGSYPAGSASLPVTLVRLLADGTVDSSFNGPSLSWSTTVGFTPAGTLDPARGVSGQWLLRSVGGSPFSGVVPQPDGGVIVYGIFGGLGGQPAPGIARLTNTGQLDANFSVGSGPEYRQRTDRNPIVQQVTLAPDGKLWVAGVFDTFGGRYAPGLVRLQPNGAVDTAFTASVGYTPFIGGGAQIAFGPTGEVVLAGTIGWPWEIPAGLTRLVSHTAPAIINHPANVEATQGGSATFSVGVTPGLQAAYQWFRNGNAIAGATNSTLQLNNVQAADLGNYTVRVTTAAGQVTSNAATLGSSAPAPLILDQPAGVTVVTGGRLQLRVGVSGPVSYQWMKGGQDIAGATGSEFVIPNVAAGDAGGYSVRVSNFGGSVTSAVATVAVVSADALLWQAFTEVGSENSPARILSDGAGKLYFPWTVTGVSPDMVRGRLRGPLVRLDENDGTFDASFRVDASIAAVRHVAFQGDGRIIAGVTAADLHRVIRLHADGSTDTSFNAPVFARGVRFVALQPDGKVLVAATDNLMPNPPAGALAVTAPTIYRLLANGTPDPAFTPVELNAPNGNIFGPPVVDAQGRIHICGGFTTVNGTARTNLARLNADGTLDTAFPTNLPAGWASLQGRGVLLQSDGRAVFFGDFRYTARGTTADSIMAVRFNTDGSFDTTFAQPLRTQLGFGANLRLRWLERLPDDRMVGVSNRLVRLTANGELDQSFSASSLTRETFWLALGTNGRIFLPDLAGVNGAASVLPVWQNGVAVFAADGAPASAFQTGGWGRSTRTNNGVVLPDGRVWIGGVFNRHGGTSLPGLAQFSAAGQLTGTQATFPANAPLGAQLQPFAGIASAGGDRIFVAFMNAANTTSGGFQTLQRLNADGTVDPSFVPELPAGYGLGGSTAFHASPGGRLVLSQSSVSAAAALAGNIGNALLRLNADGSRDTGFNPNLSSFAIVERGANNAVTAIRSGGLTVNQILPDGRILVTVAAVDGNLRLQRLHANGALDPTFTPPSFGSVTVFVGFTTPTFDPVTNTTAQHPSSTYSSSGVIAAVRQMADGRVYVGATLAGQPAGLLRLLPGGAIDTSFNSGGAGFANSSLLAPVVLSLEQDAAGRIYAAGRFDSYNGVAVPGLCRLNPDGSLDTTWAPGIGVHERPTLSVRLQILGDQLHLFGPSAGNVGDALPTPFRIVSLAQPGASGITAQPLSQTLVAGQPLQLFVGVAGPGPYTFQWRRNGVNIPGANTATFVVPNPAAGDGGSYDVVVTSAGGQTFTSAAAVINTSGLLASLHGIGDLPGGIALSQVRDATRVGNTLLAVGTASANPGSTVFDTAVFWSSAEGLVALPNLVTNNTATSFITASALTRDGSFIASRARANTGTLRHAVRVTRDGLTNLNLGGLGGLSGYSAATAISESGTVLYGFAQNANNVLQAVRFETAGPSMTLLPLVSGYTESNVAGRGVSSDGAVAVGITSDPAQTNFAWAVAGNRAFRYTHANTSTTLLPLLPGGTWNGALAVTSDGGQTLVAADSHSAPRGEFAVHHATGGLIRRLGTPNSAWGPSNFGGLTADGTVAVGNFGSSSSNSSYTYFRNVHGWFHLHSALSAAGVDLSEWKLDGALGISPDGRLVFGSGIRHGTDEGFVAELPAGFLANFNALPQSAAGQAIVGTWLVDDAVLLFLPEGIYYHLEKASNDDIAQGAAPGFERGTYTWNPATGQIRITTLVDTNGDIGLSDANGRTDITVQISGDVASVHIPGDGTFQLQRLLGAPGTLTGGWVVGDPTVADQSSAVVFLPDGTYMLADDGPQDDTGGRDGLEAGTFTWNPGTGVFTVTTTLDLNGNWGLSHNVGTATIELDGSSRFVFRDAEDTVTVTRVGPAQSAGPSVRDQPFSRRVATGNAVEFRVGATGSGTVSYQWHRNGAPISGATAMNYSIPVTTTADAGIYHVVVNDANGTLASTQATLTLLPVDNVLWQSFTEFSSEHAPARILSDGAGKLYVPWTVQAQSPDMAGGRYQGALVRLNEADGSVDMGFRVDRRYAAVRHVAFQPDGRILAAVSVGDLSRVVRLHADGSTDTTFTSPLFARGVRFITRQADGKVLVAATDNLSATATASHVAHAAASVVRLHADGSIDQSFMPASLNAGGLLFGPPVADAQGRVYLAGTFNNVSGTGRINVARLNPDGTVDQTFAASLPAGWGSAQARGVALQSDGRAIFVGDFRYTARGTPQDPIMAVRFNTDGTLDTTFAQPLRTQLGIAQNLRLRWLEVLPDNRIVGISDRMVRLEPDGFRDEEFQSRPFAREAFWFARGTSGRLFAPDLNGVMGNFTMLPLWSNGIAAFFPDGTPDTGFQTGGWGRVTHTSGGVALSDGRVWIGGVFNRYGGTPLPGLAQFSAAGQLTGTQAVFPASAPLAARLQPFAAVASAGSDRIFAAFMNAANTTTGAFQALQRLNADGSVDSGFVPDLPAGYGLGGSTAFHASPGGRLVLSQSSVSAAAALAGNIGNALLRLNADGSRDTGFTPNLSSFAIVERDANNVVTAIRTGGLTVNQILPDGSILTTVAAVDGNLRLQRLLPTGAVDGSFNPPSFGNVTVVVGFTGPTFDPVTNTTAQHPLSTYSSSGVIRAAAQNDSGQVYVGGAFTLSGKNGLVRLNSSGQLDAPFMVSGSGIGSSRSESPAAVNALALDAAGRLYVAGNFDSYNGTAVPGLFRLSANGSFDNTWNPGFGVHERPFVNVRLQVVGDTLYVFGAAGGPNDALPVPFRTVNISAAPVITTQPVATQILEGAGATLSVVANSPAGGAVTFQWYRNGVALTGATGSFLSLNSTTGDVAGNYHVVVTTAFGSTTSATVPVTVVPSAPVFNAQAGIQTSFGPMVLPAGTNAALQAIFSAGSRPMTFQWNYEGQPIPGATGELYYLQDWQPSDAGLYSVTATNAHGSATSAAERIHITPEAGWRWENPKPHGNALTRVSFVNGQFIIGGLRGTLLVSTDGVAWQTRHVPAANNLFGFRYANGRYVTLGSLNLILSSTDGHIWTSHDTGLDGSVTQLQDMTFGGGRFVAVGTGGVTARSTDGVTWTPGTMGADVTETIIGITYVLNKFWAVGTGTGRVYSSTDGESWTWAQTPAASLRNLNYGAGRLVAVGANGVIVTSTNGLSWTAAQSGTTQGLVGIDFVNGRFIATGTNDTLLTSFDGLNWTARSVPATQVGLQSAAFGNGRYIVVGQGGITGRALLTSTDAINWTSLHTGPRQTSQLLAVASNSTTVVAVGQAGAILSSTDGQTWIERSSGTSQTLNDVTYAAGRFLAVGGSGTVLSSLDGATWSSLDPTGLTSVTLLGVRHDGAQWIAVSLNGNAYTSPDGIAWSLRSTPSGTSLRKLVIANGQSVAVGISGAIVTSPDGVTWTLRRPADGIVLNDIAHGASRYVAVGAQGLVATSTNGHDWTSQRISNTQLLSVNYYAGHFIATGQGHHYYTSTDGLNWSGRFTGSQNLLQDTALFGERVIGVGLVGNILSAGAPVLSGPASQTANLGARVVLKAVVSESPFPVDYVWTRNGDLIEGVNSPLLVIPAAAPADAGDYVLTVVGPLGSATSAPATLTLNVGVQIVGQPQPQVALVGGSASFNVTASGTPAPTYQWRRNGVDIPGATGPSLQLTNLTLADSGSITVLVRNAVGSVTSEPVALTVNPLPPLITSPGVATALINAPFTYQITTTTSLAAFNASPLPPGLAFNAQTGTLSGTPTQAGNYSITLTASNVSGQNQRLLQLTVQAPPPAITSPASASGRVGVFFNYTIAGTNSPSGFSAQGLPGGLALNGAVISGTPTAAGTFSVLLSAQNATGTGSSVLTLSIAPPLNAPVYNGAPALSGTAGTFFSFTPNFGAGNTGFALGLLPSGAPSVLPAGLQFNAATGVISGTATEIGTFPIALTATNNDGATTVQLSLTINPAPTAPALTSPSSIIGTAGAPFTFTLTANPAAGSFGASGLPAGLSLNAATGVISGTPQQPGISTAGIAASNGAGLTVGTLTFIINASPNAPVITGSPLVTGRAGTALAGVQLAATNAPEEFVIVSGTLPANVQLNAATGALTGTPSAPGETRVWVAARNASGRGPALEMVFFIDRALNVPVITSNGTASGQAGQPFVYQITATNAPLSFAASTLPAGLQFDAATGVISGLPAAETAQPAVILLTASNNDGTSAIKQLFLTIAAPPATPRITSATSAGGRVGTAFSYQITASESPTSYAATGLPAGLQLDSATGAITGTPSVAGGFPVGLRAGNTAGLGQVTTVQFNLAAAPTAPAITSAPTASGQVGVLFNYAVIATGSPTSFALAGSLPDGLAFNTSTGVISGNPADDPGLYSVTVSASNEAGTSQPQLLLLSIAPAANAPVITSPNSASTTVGAVFTYQITATNIPSTTPFPPSVWLDAIGLPPGLAVNPSTGLIVGTPTTVGTSTVFLHGVNESGSGLPRALTITVNPAPNAPVVNSASAASAQVGTAFTYTITATNQPTSFEALDAPPWLQVNTATGLLSGAPTTPGVFALQLRAANAGGASNLAPLTLSVAAAPNTPVVTSVRTATAQVGAGFSYTIQATLSPTSYLATGLPAGLALDGATGAITGTPTVSGTFNVTLSASNANGQGQPVTLTLTINPSLQITGN